MATNYTRAQKKFLYIGAAICCLLMAIGFIWAEFDKKVGGFVVISGILINFLARAVMPKADRKG